MARDISVEELAERIGITPARLSRCEAATADMTAEELKRAASALRLPCSHFVAACVFCGQA